MCTASWLHGEKSFELFFNRDEARTRGIARPPEILQKEGVAFIAPRDADFGGTWLAVNEFGLVLCLLNNYQSAASLFKDYFGSFVSRGEIIPGLIHAADMTMCRRLAETIDCKKYRPFVLGAFGGDTAFTLAWDGKAATFAAPVLPLISSAFNYSAAKNNRGGLFRNAAPLTADKMLALHRSHLPEKGELSICMHSPSRVSDRAEAHTVSLTRVSVDRNSASMEYFSGNPCETTESTLTKIARR